jgi:hypothetical protein
VKLMLFAFSVVFFSMSVSANPEERLTVHFPSVEEAPAFAQAILQDLRSSGGSGRILTLVEASTGVKKFSGVEVNELPEYGDRQSPFIWMRTAPASILIRQMKKQGVPLLLSSIGEGVGAYVVPTANPRGEVVLKAIGSDKNSYMVLQPSSAKPTIVHEFQHWKDFEDPAILNFMGEAYEVLQRNHVGTDLDFFYQSLIEYRGYAQQESSILLDLSRDYEVTDDEGEILTHEERREDLLIQKNQALKNFEVVGSYRGKLFEGICATKKKSERAYLELIKKLDALEISNPGGEISLRAIASDMHFCGG